MISARTSHPVVAFLRSRERELLARLQAADENARREPALGIAPARDEDRFAVASELARVRGALVRVGEGTFGACSLCAEAISVETLEVTPEAPFCDACASRSQRELCLGSDELGTPGAVTRGATRARVRRDLHPEDHPRLAAFHCGLLGSEHGFSASLEGEIALPLEYFLGSATASERMWIAEHEGEIVGTCAVVAKGEGEAQLKWFIVHPSHRQLGLGSQFLALALGFARRRGYERVVARSMQHVESAARCLTKSGFELEEELVRERWGKRFVETRWVADVQSHPAEPAQPVDLS